MVDAASENPGRAAPACLLWWTWLVGPASYGFAYSIYLIAPEAWYGTADPGPDLGLAMLMVLTHLVAGVCTVVLLVAPRQWRAPEFWVLLVYWAGIAGWIVPALWLSDDRSGIDPTIPWLCGRVSIVAVILMPVVGLARRAMRRAASTRPA